jgi:hypothetical protein
MRKLKNYFTAFFMSRKINRLVYHLDKDKRTNSISFYDGGKGDPNWIYYYVIFGFIGESYFSAIVWKHAGTEKGNCFLDNATDEDIKTEITDIIKELSGIELKQLFE